MDLLTDLKKGNSTFVIAEIGQNHQGDINIAKKLINIAKDCGADCAKFQKTCIKEKFAKSMLDAPYTSSHSWGATYGEHKAHLEFSDDDFLELQRYCKEIGILFTASAMDCVSLKFLADISVPFIKIASGDANNFVMLEEAARTNIPLVISTGMQEMETVREIYELVSKYHKNFAFLHCVSSYPTPYDEINLEVINLYKQEFPDIVIGYSGHEPGFHITFAAVALGAKIVERHITFDKSSKGTDHNCSLDQNEFKTLVSNIRNLELARGKPIKKMRNCEKQVYKKLGKSLVFARNLKAGHTLLQEDIKVKVCIPKGVDPSKIKEIVGKKINCQVEADNPVFYNNLE